MATFTGTREGEQYVLDEFVLVPGTTPFEYSTNTANPDNPAFNLNVMIQHGSLGQSTGAIAANMETVCATADDVLHLSQAGILPIIHQFQPSDKIVEQIRILENQTIDTRIYPLASVRKDGRPLYGIGVGFKNARPNSEKYFRAGAPILRLDTPNGYTPSFSSTVREIRQMQDEMRRSIGDIREISEQVGQSEVWSGNVGTPEGVQRLAKAGSHVIIGGIGSGTGCGTATFIGAHVAQATVLKDCEPVAKELGVGLVSDGGARRPNTWGFALACADRGVMSGSLFAATEESPAEKRINENGVPEAHYYGSASTYARIKRALDYPEMFTYNPLDPAEGHEGWIPVHGAVQQVMSTYIHNLYEQMNYVGAQDLSTFRQYAVLQHLSPSAMLEIQKGYINGTH